MQKEGVEMTFSALLQYERRDGFLGLCADQQQILHDICLAYPWYVLKQGKSEKVW